MSMHRYSPENTPPGKSTDDAEPGDPALDAPPPASHMTPAYTNVSEADVEGDWSPATAGRAPLSPAARARAFVHDHPWLVFGSAVGVGAALGYGSRHLPDRPVSRAMSRAPDALPTLASTVGSALLRFALTAGLRRIADRV